MILDTTNGCLYNCRLKRFTTFFESLLSVFPCGNDWLSVGATKVRWYVTIVRSLLLLLPTIERVFAIDLVGQVSSDVL